MTRTVLLECLRDFTREATNDVILPVHATKEKPRPKPRSADVYLMRLKKSSASTMYAPYILHQVITGKDIQPESKPETGRTVVRSIFAVYHDDESEGGLALLELMERLRIELLRRVVIGKQFQLDLKDGLETLIYPDDTAPYYAGEMISTWIMPGVGRENIVHGK